MASLFETDEANDAMKKTGAAQPLAARMRPQTIDDIVGQRHLLAPDKPLYQILKRGNIHSMIFWGPPGSGKTTLARVAGASCNAKFTALSAVFSGVKDIQAAVKAARMEPRRSVLFVDEVHRFNKAQQDAFLPEVESGGLTFIGATTENPSFEVNNALLSRVRVYVLHRLSEDDLLLVLRHAMEADNELANSGVEASEEICRRIAATADGDARKALNLLEICVGVAQAQGATAIDDECVRFSAGETTRRFDLKGDAWYDQISAMHKSIRGSDPDATLYWMARMLDGGCDPLYIARRLVRIASEDIGNADTRAWDIALNAWMTYERLGTPEGELAIAHAAVYQACAPKSNAVYAAFNKATAAAKEHGSLEVPMHIRNAPTRLMRDMGYGRGYRYAHDEPEAFAAGERYLPEELAGTIYYEATRYGDEKVIHERLNYFRKLNRGKKDGG